MAVHGKGEKQITFGDFSFLNRTGISRVGDVTRNRR